MNVKIKKRIKINKILNNDNNSNNGKEKNK